MSDNPNPLNFNALGLPRRPGLTSSEVGSVGSVNDQVNRQGIIDAHLTNLDDLGKALANLDTSVIDANAECCRIFDSGRGRLDRAW